MKIIIIEDDELSLILLKKMIEKNFPDKTIEGTFYNAEDALEFLEHTEIDLVITDIKLSGMDGIRFSEICTKRHHDMPIMIISAYDDFEYARRVLNTSVVSYILKPVTFENIKNGLAVVEEKILKTKHSEFFATESIEIYKDLFKRYFSGKIESWEAEEKKLPKNNKVQLKYISVITIKIFNYENYIKNIWNYGEDRLVSTINNVICSVDSDFFGIVLSHDNNKYDIVCVFENAENQSKTEKISAYLLNTLKINCASKQLLDISPIESIKSNLSKYDLNKKISEVLEEKDIVSISTEGLSFKELSRVAKMMSETMIMNLGVDFVKEHKFDLFEYQQITDRTEMEKYVGSLIKIFNEYRRITCENSVPLIINYIEENFKKDITLETLSDIVSFSPKYFSRVFKRVTNKTVTEYIDEVRIKNAVWILENNMDIKLSELSAMVGYDEYSTFYRNFKKHTGKTANQYRSELKK